MEKFIYGNFSYQYKLIKKDRKTLTLTITPEKEIIIKAPKDISDEKLEKFLKRKWSWMNKQLDFFTKVKREKYKRKFVSGESFYYLGRQYKLVVSKGNEDTVQLLKGVLKLTTSNSVKDIKNIEKILKNWFKIKAEAIFKERYQVMGMKFDYKNLPVLGLRKMSRRWGTFINKDKICLNPKLIHASKDCIDYVITHELCHVRYKNHNKMFWKFMEEKYPNWVKVKDKLEERYSFLV